MAERARRLRLRGPLPPAAIGALAQTESCRALAKRLPRWIELAAITENQMKAGAGPLAGRTPRPRPMRALAARGGTRSLS
jgi:hypothetical protein